MTREINLPPLKVDYSDQWAIGIAGAMKEYATAAVLADRAEQQERKPKPVAWLARYRDRTGAARFYVSTEKSLTDENDDSGNATPLYEHPAQQERKPSDVALLKAIRESLACAKPNTDWTFLVAAIDEAIKETP